jgi:hypothetical protein
MQDVNRRDRLQPDTLRMTDFLSIPDDFIQHLLRSTIA